MLKKIIYVLLGIVVAAVVFVALIQLVPYGRNHTNPPVVLEPTWGSPQSKEIAQRACFDCHSNETKWPWYSNIAPGSWLVQYDVDRGRRRMNFSEWRPGKAEDIQEMVMSGEMPPFQYLIIHWNANLSPAERETLIKGLAGN